MGHAEGTQRKSRASRLVIPYPRPARWGWGRARKHTRTISKWTQPATSGPGRSGKLHPPVRRRTDNLFVFHEVPRGGIRSFVKLRESARRKPRSGIRATQLRRSTSRIKTSDRKVSVVGRSARPLDFYRNVVRDLTSRDKSRVSRYMMYRIAVTVFNRRVLVNTKLGYRARRKSDRRILYRDRCEDYGATNETLAMTYAAAYIKVSSVQLNISPATTRPGNLNISVLQR